MEGQNIEKPITMKRGLLFVCIALAAGMVRFIGKLAVDSEDLILNIVFGSIPFLIMGGVIYQIMKGKNWARFVYTAFVLCLLPFSVAPLREQLLVSPILGVLGIVQFTLFIIAILAFFRPESSAWFKQMKNNG